MKKILAIVTMLVMLMGTIPFAAAMEEDTKELRDEIEQKKEELKELREELKDTKGTICAQVITPAKNPRTGACKRFPTPCDVPRGWEKVRACPSTSDGGTDNSDSDGGLDPLPCRPIKQAAIEKTSGKCKEFRSQCDVPRGWRYVKSCDRVEIQPIGGIKPVDDITIQPIKDRKPRDKPGILKPAVINKIKRVTKAAFEDGDFTEEEKEKIKALRRDQLKGVFASNAPEEVKERLKQLKIADHPSEVAKLRDISIEKITAAREKFKKATVKFKKVDREVKEERKALQETIKQVKDCEEDCDALEEEALAAAKRFVQKSGETILAHLGKIEEKINGDESINAQRAADALEKIAKAKAEVQQQMDLAASATTKEEIRKAAKNISSIWKRIKNVTKRQAVRIVNAHTGEIIRRSESLERKLDRILADLEDQGQDIEDLDEKISNFNDHISKAKELQEQSKDLIEDAKTKFREDDEDETARNELAAVIKEARALSKQAHKELKQAHEIVMGLVREIKATSPTVDFATTPEDLVVVEEV